MPKVHFKSTWHISTPNEKSASSVLSPKISLGPLLSSPLLWLLSKHAYLQTPGKKMAPPLKPFNAKMAKAWVRGGPGWRE
jgi:hypothetical protein